MDRNIPLAITLMMTGAYMVIPTPDELLLHPFIGYAYTLLFNVDIKTGIIWSIISYNSLGCILILIALIIGGRCVLVELNTQIDIQGKKLGDQIKYTLRTEGNTISCASYNNEGFNASPEYKYELFD